MHRAYCTGALTSPLPPQSESGLKSFLQMHPSNLRAVADGSQIPLNFKTMQKKRQTPNNPKKCMKWETVGGKESRKQYIVLKLLSNLQVAVLSLRSQQALYLPLLYGLEKLCS